MAKSRYKHWQLTVDQENVAWLHLDKQGTGTNVLSQAVLKEFDRLLTRLAKDEPGGLVISSAKAGGFIAGADVTEFTKLTDLTQALGVIRQGHAVFDRLEALPFPSVAQIHGFCLGGGLELALACRYRVARNDPATRLGLPEVRLGIHPGFGGTARLVRLLGATHAMDLMLTGRTVPATRARSLGLVDAVVSDRHLADASRRFIRDMPKVKRASMGKRLASAPGVRPLLASYLRAQVTKRASPAHYPAPFALIDLWRRHGGRYRRMLREEGPSIARLVVGSTARNLVRVFLLQEHLKSLGRGSHAPVQHVHVIGAGVMGGDIAAWCALRGLTVTLQDRAPEWIAPAVARAYGFFKTRLKERRLVQAAMDRLIPDHEGSGIGRADVVIEAIIEDRKAKEALYRSIEPRLKKNAVLATNTSSIPLEQLAQRLKDPTRLVGLHFFNPVSKMQLVEVVAGKQTGPEVLTKAYTFCRWIDRLPLPVKSAPGFLVNRILMPYLLEAVTLVDEGVPVSAIDKAAKDFGMPMGPIELADTVGLDICLSVAEILAGSLDVEVPKLLREKVKAGALGRKSGRGFYAYPKGQRRNGASQTNEPVPDDVQDRLMLRMLNESVACWREGVVEDMDLLDAGMVFGTGFAPFRGGPMHHILDTGAAELKEALTQMEAAYGRRFKPDAGWARLMQRHPQPLSASAGIIPAGTANTLAGLFRERVRRTPTATAYCQFDMASGAWADATWQDMAKWVARWQAALAQESLAAGDRVALMMRSSREWVFFEQAALGLGLVVVPLFRDDRADSVAYIVKDAGVKLLVIGGPDEWRRIRRAVGRFQTVQRIVSVEPISSATDPRVVSASEWLPKKSAKLQARDSDRHALATIFYTSGTTGRPKGVMLSHWNILSNAEAGLKSVLVHPGDLFLSFLPLSHAFERTVGYYTPMMAGATVAFARGIPELAEDLKTVRPTCLISVPRIFERIYGRVEAQLNDAGWLARWLFDTTVSVGWRQFENQQGRAAWHPSLLLWPIFRQLVARKITDGLGGRVRLTICGGAALSPKISKVFVALGVPLLHGYGLTEASPVVSVNRMHSNIPQSIGTAFPGVEVAIGEDEELLVRGPNVMMGYWNDSQASAVAIDGDGWLHTGDMARIEGEHIYITGRLKDIIVLANGEKVPPHDMETAIVTDHLIDQIVVVGESRPYLAAIAVLNTAQWKSLAAEHGLDVNDLQSERVEEIICERIGTHLHDFPGYAQVRRVACTLQPWTVDNGLLTPTLKSKRAHIYESHADDIARLYEGHV